MVDGMPKPTLLLLKPDEAPQLAEYQGKYGRLSPDGKLIAIMTNDTTIKLRQVDGLDGLLTRGCNWLEEYLATHDNKLHSELCRGVLSNYKSLDK